jgi:hypothetical protein
MSEKLQIITGEECDQIVAAAVKAAGGPISAAEVLGILEEANQAMAAHACWEGVIKGRLTVLWDPEEKVCRFNLTDEARAESAIERLLGESDNGNPIEGP